MANKPGKIRIPRPMYPWSDPSDQFEDPVELYVNRVLQNLERNKLEIATVNATGAFYGDILVADINRVFQPQKFVPLNLGVGLSVNPIYRFQVQDGGVQLHLTDSASGGAHGVTLNAASGTSNLAYMLASGDVTLWEIGFDTGGNLLLRSHLTNANILISDSAGNISLLRNVGVGNNLTVTGSTVLFGNVTTGPLVANTLQVTGNTWLFGTTRTGPLVVNTLQVTGDTWLFGNNNTGPLVVNTLQVTGNAWLFGTNKAGPLTVNTLQVTGNTWLFGTNNAGPLTCNSLVVTGTSVLQSTLAVSGDAAFAGKFGLNGKPPVASDGSYINSYSTADRTLSAYTSNDQSSSYSGIDNTQVGTVYAKVSDLNTLRSAYETLRTFTEDLAQQHNSLIAFLKLRGDIT